MDISVHAQKIIDQFVSNYASFSTDRREQLEAIYLLGKEDGERGAYEYVVYSLLCEKKRIEIKNEVDSAI